MWADGVHFNIRLEEERQCILVLMGAKPDGDKEVIAISEGYRESEQSWRALLLDCKERGLEIDPELAIANDHLGSRPWHKQPSLYGNNMESQGNSAKCRRLIPSQFGLTVLAAGI